MHVVAARAPRLDWFQQMGSLTLVLYAGMVPRGPGRTPPWVRARLDEKGLLVSVLVRNVGGVAGTSYATRLQLHAPVRWPPQALRVHPDSGKVEVILAKDVEALWPRFGEPADKTTEDNSDDAWWPASVQESCGVTHDTKLLTMQLEGRVAFTLPVGCHFRVRLHGESRGVVKCKL